MRRWRILAMAVTFAVAAAACGSTSDDSSPSVDDAAETVTDDVATVEEPESDPEIDPTEEQAAPALPADDEPAEPAPDPEVVAAAVTAVDEVMIDWHRVWPDNADGSVLDVVVADLRSLGGKFAALADRLPVTFGDADLDAALESLRTAIEQQAMANTDLAAEIEADRAALEADLAESGAELGDLEGSELGRLIDASDFGAGYDDVVAACQGLLVVVAEYSDEPIDCVGTTLFVRPGEIADASGQTFEVAGMTVAFGDIGYPVRVVTNGIQLGGFEDPCGWVGRPSAVTDADIGQTSPPAFNPEDERRLNHERPVPTSLDDLVAWLETDGMQAMLEVVSVDRPDPTGSPFEGSVTAVFREDGLFPIYTIAPEPIETDGCDGIGWGQAVRYRVLDDPAGPIILQTSVGSFDGPTSDWAADAAAQLDAADDLYLGTFELITG